MYFIFILIFSILSGNFLFSQEQKQLTQEEQEMMKLWQEYATPGKPHDHFKYFQGSWLLETRVWHAPDSEAITSKGSAEAELIFDGRYLLMEYEGTFNGMKFEGMTITGYDNAKKKYQSIWIDNFGTGIYPTEGTCSADFKECTDEGDWYDPMKKMNYKVKLITKKINEDFYKSEMYITYPKEKTFKSMEINYKRKK